MPFLPRIKALAMRSASAFHARTVAKVRERRRWLERGNETKRFCIRFGWL